MQQVLGLGTIVLIVICVARALFSIRARADSRWPWGWLAGLIGLQGILHWYTAPFLADIEPSTLMLVSEETLRFSLVWRAFLGLPPRVIHVSELAFINNIIGTLMLLPLLSFLLNFWRDARTALVSLTFAVFAVVPLKYMSSEGQFALFVFCGVAAADRFLSWLETERRLDLCLAAICVSFAVNLRPEGVLASMAVALLVFSRPTRLRALLRPLNLAVIVLPATLFALEPFLSLLSEAAGGEGLAWFALNPLFYLAFTFAIAPIRFPFAEMLFVNVLAIALAVIVFSATIIVVWRRPLLRSRLLLLAGMTVAVSFGMIREVTVASERYLLMALLFQAAFAGAVLHHAVSVVGRNWLSWRRAIAQVVVCAVVLATAFSLEARILTKKWPHTVEYEFALRVLPEIPDGAVILADLFWEREAGLEFHEDKLSRLVGKSHEWLDLKEPGSLTRDGDLFLYVGGSCRIRQRSGQGFLHRETFTELYPKCRAALEALRDDRREVELLFSIKARGTSFLGDEPVADKIPLEWYRVGPARPSESPAVGAGEER